MAGGLVPVRHITGDNSFTTRRFKKTGAATNEALVYVGDVVYILADGSVRRLVATPSAANGPTMVGVVANIYTDEQGTPRVHGLPTQHPNISLSADTDFLDVYIDPGIVYAANIGTSAGGSDIGSNAQVSAGARVTAAGQSGTTLAVTTSADGVFKIIGMSQFQLGTRQGNTNGDVEVIVNSQWLKSTTSV